MRVWTNRWTLRKLVAALLFTASLTLFALVVLHPAPEKEERDLQRKRQEWFYRQRAYPHAHVPAGARLAALQQLEQKLQTEGAMRASGMARETLSSVLPNPAWSFIGPRPIQTPYSAPIVSGRVSAMAIDPTNVNVVYLGGAQGGVWKTTNGGNTWIPLTDTQASTSDWFHSH